MADTTTMVITITNIPSSLLDGLFKRIAETGKMKFAEIQAPSANITVDFKETPLEFTKPLLAHALATDCIRQSRKQRGGN